MKFNKTEYELEFVSRDFIIEISERNNMEVEVVDNSKHTSNIIYIIKSKSSCGQSFLDRKESGLLKPKEKMSL